MLLLFFLFPLRVIRYHDRVFLSLFLFVLLKYHL